MRRLALLSLLAVVLATAGAGSSSLAHYPATNGWIVFASDRTASGSGAFRLYRLEPLGGRVTPLGALRGRQPAWSPDGSLIAFVDARLRLVVAHADGTRLEALTSGKPPVQDPAWAPDGSRIVFQEFGRGRFTGDIAIVTTTGSVPRRITRTKHADAEPTWSPDGSLIAFVSNRDPVTGVADDEIYVVRPDGGGLRRLTKNDYRDRSPAWSPDGSLIAFESGRNPFGFNPELWTMGSDGGGERRVQLASEPSGFPSWSDTSPGWSPDGNWLIYVTNQTFYPENVFIVRPDGRDKIDLTPETRSLDIDPAWQPVCSDPGTPADDRLRGTIADDRVCGFAGDDLLSAGKGRDGLYGGDGNDTLRSRDGLFDVVGCGAGRDDVLADRFDLVGADCERIRRS
jgi:Tol biopolymer transport system component